VVPAMNTPDAAPLRKLFREKYPEVNLTIPAPRARRSARASYEMRAGKVLLGRGLVQPPRHRCARAGRAARRLRVPRNAQRISTGAVDPQGRGRRSTCANTSSGYNTGFGPRLQARRLGDCCSPFWKEKFAMDESDVEWYAAMLDYLRKRKGPAFMRSLARQKPQFRRGPQPVAKLLVAGDFRWRWCTRRNGRGEAGGGARRLGRDPRSGDHLAEQIAVSVKRRIPPPRASSWICCSRGGPGAYPRRDAYPLRTTSREGPPRFAESALREPAARARSRSHENEFREIFLRGR